jgi:hypothetical protein
MNFESRLDCFALTGEKWQETSARAAALLVLPVIWQQSTFEETMSANRDIFVPCKWADPPDGVLSQVFASAHSAASLHASQSAPLGAKHSPVKVLQESGEIG